MSGAKPWVANGPEDRLSIAVDRFLRRALVPPFYVVAVMDEDGGKRSQQQRVRDANRGRRAGQLDWDVWQAGTEGYPTVRKLELKRGNNSTTEKQDQTIADLTACGAPPVVAWDLFEVYHGLAAAGFRFLPNVETTFQHIAEELAGWDREADLIKSGEVVRKVSKPRAVGPRFQWGKGATKRAAGRGVLVAALLAVLALPAIAAPPPGTDLSSSTHAWFERQHNIRGGWCCDLADGHVLDPDDWRITGKAYEVRISGQWLAVEGEAVRDPNGGPNPVGQAIVWYSVNEYGTQIFCFAPGAEW